MDMKCEMRSESRIVLALDVTKREKALEVVEAVGSIVDAVKVNWPIILGCGISIVDELSEHADIICDMKIADIPNTNRLIVEQAVAHGARGVIAHGFVGKDSIEACIKASHGSNVFVVTEMSHPGGKEFTQPNGNRVAKMAKDVGADGVIAPATRPGRISEIRTIVGNELKILSPGVGAQGGSASDAIKAGADYIIVGRSIYNTKDPAQAANAIAKEISDL